MASPIKNTGSVDFSGGVDSLRTPTIVSERNPNGLDPNQLAWLVNATVRGGAIQPRDGWQPKGWINEDLPPIVTPGKPGQTIPQPPIPPFQTPQEQNIQQVGIWHIGPIGTATIMTVSNSYSGNVGDVQTLYSDPGPFQSLNGNFLITGFTANTITLQTISSVGAGGSTNNSLWGFNLAALAPGTPQPPIIIPPGPPNLAFAAPFFQGAVNPLYTPTGPDSFSATGTPYGICVIGGHVVAFDPDFILDPVDLSAIWNQYHPSNTPRCFFQQAEKYLVIQAGDYNVATGQGTLPLFWDGFTLKRSNGITGVLAVGEPLSNTFTISTSTSWTPPAAAYLPNGAYNPTGQSTITLSVPYNSNVQNLGDNLAIVSGTTLIGNFRVIGINGNNITLQTLTLTTPGTYTGSLICTLITAPASTPVAVVTIGNGSWAIPSVGSNGAINLTSLYFGSVGDTITVQSEDASLTFGTFQVVSFTDASGATPFQLVLKTLSPSTAYTGTVVSQGNFLVTVTACRPFWFQESQNGSFHWVIPAVGSTTTLQWNGSGSSGGFFGSLFPITNIPSGGGSAGNGVPYPGSLYDIVQATHVTTGALIGVFRVVRAVGGYPPFMYQIGLQAISINVPAGTVYTNANPKLTVVVPPSNPQFLTLNSGQWTMPPVGSSVTLQMNWKGTTGTPPVGPSYPGSIGDTITIVQNNPVTDIGQFLVTAFDNLGNITLQAVNPTGGFTNTTAGTVFVGPINATVNFILAPSSTGLLINQIPAAGVMVYYQGILWYAQGDIVSGGDVVGGPSGTSTNDYLDSVLNVTENPLAIGGDGFKIPIPGNITGMNFPSQIDASLGQGLLFIGTINGICTLQVPATRQLWIAASGSNQPQINVFQFNNGWTNDLGIVSINGDLYFPSLMPDIRSLIQASRFFGQQGNKSISSNERRLFNFVDTTLLGFASGIYFNNRLLMAMFPKQTKNGVVHTALIPLDMEPLSTLENENEPNWEGGHEALQWFQLMTGNFNGKQRAFAIALNANNPGEIDCWENMVASPLDGSTDADDTDTERRIEWQLETPAFTWDQEMELKKLVSAELWVDRIKGICDCVIEYRPDSSTCWISWKKWSLCFARNSAEDLENPIAYPLVPFPPGYKQMMSIPEPKSDCQQVSRRPSNVGYQFQFRLTITGFCRVRGLFFKAESVDKQLYQDLVCDV